MVTAAEKRVHIGACWFGPQDEVKDRTPAIGAVFGASWSFVLPVSTPPNSIVAISYTIAFVTFDRNHRV